MTDVRSESSSDWTAARDEGVRLLGERDFDGAAAQLTAASAADDSGQSDAWLGLARFQSEDYSGAASNYRAALERDPSRTDWQHMLSVSEANAHAEVNVFVPDVRYFDRDDLLAAPPDPGLPEPGSPGFSLGILKRVRYVVGHAVGSVAGFVFDGLVELLGRHYRGDVWTNWYRKSMYRGILTLAYMREKLDRDNLMSTYPEGSKVGSRTTARPTAVGTTSRTPRRVLRARASRGTWRTPQSLPRPVTGCSLRTRGR
jgi:hypothetical protein